MRRRIAKKNYKVLRAEAKSLTNVKYQLENKVVELTQQLRKHQSENKEHVYADFLEFFSMPLVKILIHWKAEFAHGKKNVRN